MDDIERVRRAIIGVLGHRFTDTNMITALRNGDEIFPAMLEAVRDAEHSVEFVTFVYWTGDIADQMADALAERARAGVTIRVVLDGFGSLQMDQGLIETMRQAGVQVERFRPPTRWKVWEADHRTHRKILVVDDRLAFTGGVGIAAEWEGDARNPDEWRDTHFRIEGPSALGLKAAFLADWRDSEQRVNESDLRPELRDGPGHTEIAVMNASAQIGFNEAERVLEAVLSVAQRRIIIQTPYFNPTDVVSEALSDARRRDVAIDLVVPGEHIDKRVSAITAQREYRPLIEEGVRVWRYGTSMFHTKALLIDDAAAVIGSVNINRRSVEKAAEKLLSPLDSEM